MVGHKTIRIEIAMRRQRAAFLILRECLLTQEFNKLPIVVSILKDILVIDTSEHHMINTRSTTYSSTSRHIVNNDSVNYCRKYTVLLSRVQEKHAKSTQMGRFSLCSSVKSTQKEPSHLCSFSAESFVLSAFLLISDFV